MNVSPLSISIQTKSTCLPFVPFCKNVRKNHFASLTHKIFQVLKTKKITISSYSKTTHIQLHFTTHINTILQKLTYWPTRSARSRKKRNPMPFLSRSAAGPKGPLMLPCMPDNASNAASALAGDSPPPIKDPTRPEHQRKRKSPRLDQSASNHPRRR